MGVAAPLHIELRIERHCSVISFRCVRKETAAQKIVDGIGRTALTAQFVLVRHILHTRCLVPNNSNTYSTVRHRPLLLYRCSRELPMAMVFGGYKRHGKIQGVLIEKDIATCLDCGHSWVERDVNDNRDCEGVTKKTKSRLIECSQLGA